MLSMQELLQRALGGDATAAAELWRAIAEGKADDAITAAWARDVAKHVAAKVEKNGTLQRLKDRYYGHVDVLGYVGAYTSMIMVNGRPAIAYYDAYAAEVKYLRAPDMPSSYFIGWMALEP